jgi:hypothetical protein
MNANKIIMFYILSLIQLPAQGAASEGKKIVTPTSYTGLPVAWQESEEAVQHEISQDFQKFKQVVSFTQAAINKDQKHEWKLIRITDSIQDATKNVQLLLVSAADEEKCKMLQSIEPTHAEMLTMPIVLTKFANAADSLKKISFFAALFTFNRSHFAEWKLEMANQHKIVAISSEYSYRYRAPNCGLIKVNVNTLEYIDFWRQPYIKRLQELAYDQKVSSLVQQERDVFLSKRTEHEAMLTVDGSKLATLASKHIKQKDDCSIL